MYPKKGQKIPGVVNPKPSPPKTVRAPVPQPAPTTASTSQPKPASYAKATKRSEPAATQTIQDFLAAYYLRKLAQTLRIIQERLGSATPQEKFFLLVEACQTIGVL